MDLDIHCMLIFQLFFYCTAEEHFFNNYNDDGDFSSTFLLPPPEVQTGLVDGGSPDGLWSVPTKVVECGITPKSCPENPYRSLDGSCNNLKNPTWGTPFSAYKRLLSSKYADGIKEPPKAKSGNPLPMARNISLLLHPDVPSEDHMGNLNLMQYGQIIAHDMSKTLGSSQTEADEISCCSADGQLLEEKVPGVKTTNCFPILIPSHDPAHSHYKCINYHRTVTNADRNCLVEGNSKAIEQLTSVNHYLDLSLVYGNDVELSRHLRQFKGGRLRTDLRNGHHWPPRPTDTSATCRPAKPTDACYLAGDARLNQTPHLTIIHIILLREHNRISDILSSLNPHWDDERLFQEARRINIAEHQHNTYYEWLPYYIGKEKARESKLIWDKDGFINDYNESVDVSVLNEHATGVMKYFHTLVRGTLDLVAENGCTRGTVRFAEVWRRPQVLEEENGMDDLIRSLTRQAHLASDEYFDREMTQFLFRPENETFGADLKALDIQRSRDHGLASYNDYRKLSGLPRAKKFEDFKDYIKDENIKKLAALYEDPDDVDLLVGGSLEKKVPGALIGPTLLNIFVTQLYRTRVGDRFWFENEKNGLNSEQLKEIRKSTISRILCDNGHSIKEMQPRGFEKVSVSNKLVPCDSLPSVNLSLWKDVNGSKPDSTS